MIFQILLTCRHTPQGIYCIHVIGGTDNIIFEIDEVKINSRFDANPECVSVDHSAAIIRGKQ